MTRSEHFLLILSALIPVAVANIFYWLDKKTKFGNVTYWKKQIIIGIAFGISACLATQFGVETQDGAVLNVRGASPLTAGLVFGGPAGIIAGLIGGLYRWLSVNWGIGSYTVVACTLGTIFAGFIGAGFRKFLFDNKKALWFYGLFIGATTEVLHMLLVFITHMNEIERSFEIVKACAVPMIIANTVSVMLSVLLIAVGENEKLIKRLKQRQITQTFSTIVLLSVVVAFVVTGAFTYVLQDSIAHDDIKYSLEKNIEDVGADIRSASDKNLLGITENVAAKLKSLKMNSLPEKLTDKEKKAYRKTLKTLLSDYNVSEINIVGDDGIIIVSTNPEFDGFDMWGKEDGQAIEFKCLTENAFDYVQEYTQMDYDSSVYRKYAGIRLEKGFVQVGYDTEHFQDAINKQVELAAQNRHIGDNGFVFIVDADTKQIVSVPKKLSDSSDDCAHQELVNSFADRIDSEMDEEVIRISDGKSLDMYCMQIHTEGYIIIACVYADDAHFSRNISVYVGLFLMEVVFAGLFVVIYMMLKKTIVDNIHKINGSLAKITDGNLETKVDVKTNEEFATLSDDINTTVDTLKHYIAEAEERVDKELEFAKAIQFSSLPSVFPPYPNRRDFDIFATMDTAKEVGGDFYDFYFIGENKLVILVADVSGKGIPAAMFMMTAKTMIKNIAETGVPVNEIMTQANNKLCEMNEAGMFVTAWIGIIDLSSGKINYVSAGHNPPLVKHQNGEFEYIRGRSGLVLAGMEGIKYRAMEAQILPNDKIFLYTDGVTEATDKDNQLYGEERLKNYLNSRDNLDVEETCKGVLDDINDFVGEAPQFDDITILMFNLNEINNYNELTLAPTVESIPRVTEFIESWMLRTKIEQKIVRKVNVIVDEIYSNIANYSGSLWARVHYTRDLNSLTLTFTDNGVEYNPLLAKTPDTTLSADEREIGGLGIMMVKKMSNDVQYEYVDGQNKLKIVISLN